MQRNTLLVSVFLTALLSGCGPSGDEATGENTQLKKRLEQAQVQINNLNLEVTKLREENKRLEAQQSALTSGKSMSIEEMQKFLDSRKASLDEREESLIARETSIESQLNQRREEIQKELDTREKAVLKREQEILQRENEFFKQSNSKMKDIGAAQFTNKEYESMRSERDSANAKADKWLQFIWGVSIALVIAVILIVALSLILYNKHLNVSRELRNRQDVARLLGTVFQSQLPPEQGAIVVDALNRLSQVEDKRDTGSPTA